MHFSNICSAYRGIFPCANHEYLSVVNWSRLGPHQGETKMKLYRIDASAREAGSYSRKFGDELERALKPQSVVRRNLAKAPVDHISEITIAGFFSPPETHTDDHRAAMRESDKILAEIIDADAILITTPMYNFGVPSGLKAWLDQVVRIGKTFSFDGTTFKGLIKGKAAYVVIAYGAAGYGDNGSMASADFVKPYMDFILRFMGFEDIRFVTIEGVNTGPDAVERALSGATRQVNALAR
jgi:FMN-dependent NADH-azoreductase